MLIVSTWLWGSKYGHEYVERLAAGVRRHVKQPFRWAVFHPEPEDEHLTKIPGCFCRLRMFDPEWQFRNGFKLGDQLVSIDLDAIVTGDLDPLFGRPETFVILAGANSKNPNPFNGSVFLLRAGHHADIWSGFSVEAAAKEYFFAFPDDQSWFHAKMPDAAVWECGPESGIWSFAKGKGAAAWPSDNKLPSGARIVAFPGHRDPSQFTHLDWVKEHWT